MAACESVGGTPGFRTAGTHVAFSGGKTPSKVGVANVLAFSGRRFCQVDCHVARSHKHGSL
jgi:hypothetical protein